MAEIEKNVVLRAPLARVWDAITDPEKFGAWFQARLAGPFVPGKTTEGSITTPGYEHLRMELQVERIEPQTLFSFRWHPYAVDPAADYSAERPTLVEFRLREVPEGTALTIVESGFDGVALARRAEAFRMNDAGWAEQVRNLERYVAGG